MSLDIWLTVTVDTGGRARARRPGTCCPRCTPASQTCAPTSRSTASSTPRTDGVTHSKSAGLPGGTRWSTCRALQEGHMSEKKNDSPPASPREPLFVEVPTALGLVHEQVRLETKGSRKPEPPLRSDDPGATNV